MLSIHNTHYTRTILSMKLRLSFMLSIHNTHYTRTILSAQTGEMGNVRRNGALSRPKKSLHVS